MNNDKIKLLESVFNKINYQDFSISGYIIRNLFECHGRLNSELTDDSCEIINSYYRKEISKEEYIDKLNKIFSSHNLEFNWEDYPSDIDEIKLEKFYHSKQVLSNRMRKKATGSSSIMHINMLKRENKKLLGIIKEINNILNTNIDPSKIEMIMFTRWKKEPSIYTIPTVNDFLICLFSYGLFKNSGLENEIEQVKDSLEITPFELQQLQSKDFAKNYILRKRNLAS